MTPPISNNKQTTKTEITKANDGLRPAHQPKKPVTQPILNILIKMKNNGLSDCTIKTYDKALTYLSKHACIFDFAPTDKLSEIGSTDLTVSRVVVP